MILTEHERAIGVSPALKEKISHAVGLGSEVRQVARPLGINPANLSTLILVKRDDGRLVVVEQEHGYVADASTSYLEHLIRVHEATLRELVKIRDEYTRETTSG